MMFRIEKIKFMTAEQFYFKLQFIFNAIVAVPLVPFAMVYLDMQRNPEEPAPVGEEVSFVLKILLPLMAGITSIYGIRLFKRHLATAEELSKLRDKLILYFNAALWKYATLEAAMFFAVIGLALTRSSVFVVVFVVLLIALSLGRPTLRNIVVDLRLDKEEKRILDNKEEIV